MPTIVFIFETYSKDMLIYSLELEDIMLNELIQSEFCPVIIVDLSIKM